MTLPRRLLVPSLLAASTLVACGTIPPSAPTSAAPSSTSPSAGDTPTPTASASDQPTTTSMSPTASGAGVTCQYDATGSASKPVDLPPTTGVSNTGTVAYALKFPNGTVKVTLDRSKTPCTVNSFVSLAKQGFYDNTKCHRLADSGIFILQCGDPTATGTGGPGYQFPDELTGKEKYARGVVAMANGGPDTNGSQFFLVWDTTDLGPNYTIFGTMDKAGRDVVAAIASQGQDGSYGDGTGKPNAPATIASVTPA